MRGRFETPCYIDGRKLPTSSGIWSLFYSLLVCCCAYCKYVSFQLSFFLRGGEGSRQGLGFTCERKEGDEYRVFCYCLIQGWHSMYISILYICDENALAFCVTLPFTCTMVQHSVFQCLYSILIFVFRLILSWSLLVFVVSFVFPVLSFFVIARFITFAVR